MGSNNNIVKEIWPMLLDSRKQKEFRQIAWGYNVALEKA
jgi:hypothetical protein